MIATQTAGRSACRFFICLLSTLNGKYLCTPFFNKRQAAFKDLRRIFDSMHKRKIYPFSARILNGGFPDQSKHFAPLVNEEIFYLRRLFFSVRISNWFCKIDTTATFKRV